MIQNLLRQLGVIPVEKAGTQAEERPSDGARNPCLVAAAGWRGRLDPVGEISKPIPPPGRACPNLKTV